MSVTQSHRSRWGHHPASYETFLQLKALHKWYWETVYAVARWVRWNRKSVHRHGPEPRYCPVFVKERGHFRRFRTREGYIGTRYLPKTVVEHGVLDAYRAARTPRSTPEEVSPLALSIEEIERLYQAARASFESEPLES